MKQDRERLQFTEKEKKALQGAIEIMQESAEDQELIQRLEKKALTLMGDTLRQIEELEKYIEENHNGKNELQIIAHQQDIAKKIEKLQGALTLLHKAQRRNFSKEKGIELDIHTIKGMERKVGDIKKLYDQLTIAD